MINRLESIAEEPEMTMEIAKDTQSSLNISISQVNESFFDDAGMHPSTSLNDPLSPCSTHSSGIEDLTDLEGIN